MAAADSLGMFDPAVEEATVTMPGAATAGTEATPMTAASPATSSWTTAPSSSGSATAHSVKPPPLRKKALPKLDPRG
eukprot:3507878-Pyramimonas_sp.AAC.1